VDKPALADLPAIFVAGFFENLIVGNNLPDHKSLIGFGRAFCEVAPLRIPSIGGIHKGTISPSFKDEIASSLSFAPLRMCSSQ